MANGSTGQLLVIDESEDSRLKMFTEQYAKDIKGGEFLGHGELIYLSRRCKLDINVWELVQQGRDMVARLMIPRDSSLQQRQPVAHLGFINKDHFVRLDLPSWFSAMPLGELCFVPAHACAVIWSAVRRHSCFCTTQTAESGACVFMMAHTAKEDVAPSWARHVAPPFAPGPTADISGIILTFTNKSWSTLETSL